MGTAKVTKCGVCRESGVFLFTHLNKTSLNVPLTVNLAVATDDDALFSAVHLYIPEWEGWTLKMLYVEVGPATGPLIAANWPWSVDLNSHKMLGVGMPIDAEQVNVTLLPFWVSMSSSGKVIRGGTGYNQKEEKKLDFALTLR